MKIITYRKHRGVYFMYKDFNTKVDERYILDCIIDIFILNLKKNI